MPMDEIEPLCRKLGAPLFQKVKAWLLDHWIFDEPLDLSIVALFIFQTRCYRLLPSVFYLFVMGKPGSGKSKLLVTLSRLGRGLNLGDITAASMARELGRGREARADADQQTARVGRSTFPVFYHCTTVDELDKLGKDQRAECEGILRNGYTWDGARYTRCVGEKMTVKQWDLYMPKAMAASSGTELALGTRGFRVSAAEKQGREAYTVMLNNRWVHGADELVAELDQWADAVIASYSWEQVEAMERSPEHIALVEKVVGEVGATRSSEHIATCVTISQLIGVDITEELRHGVETISLSSEEFEDEVEAINKAIVDLVGDIDTGATVTIKQAAVKKKVNKARVESNLKPLGDNRFREAYRQAGIRDSWIRFRNGRNWWVIPMHHLALVKRLVTQVNSVTSNDELVQQTIEGDQGDQGDHLLGDLSARIAKACQMHEQGRSEEEIELTVGTKVVEHCRERGILPTIGGREG